MPLSKIESDLVELIDRTTDHQVKLQLFASLGHIHFAKSHLISHAAYGYGKSLSSEDVLADFGVNHTNSAREEIQKLYRNATAEYIIKGAGNALRDEITKRIPEITTGLSTELASRLPALIENMDSVVGKHTSAKRSIVFGVVASAIVTIVAFFSDPLRSALFETPDQRIEQMLIDLTDKVSNLSSSPLPKQNP